MGDVSPPNFHMGGLNLLGDVSPHRGNFSCYQNPFCTRVHSIAVIFIFLFFCRGFSILSWFFHKFSWLFCLILLSLSMSSLELVHIDLIPAVLERWLFFSRRWAG